ncbi:hypothetical protein DXG01_016844 [Tephrocybe rancida]|nr:hypothetical protein DXG01_016844 [Tephrocybe rancida]
MLSRRNEREPDRLINNRKLEFCPTLAAMDINELIVECSRCETLVAACCSHQSFAGGRNTCHNARLVMTDGTCSNNGQVGAKSGLGIALGFVEGWSIPVDETIDGNAPRTSQRAELLAAIMGLQILSETDADFDDQVSEAHGGPTRAQRHRGLDPHKFVVTTDSEYVVKGMTEYFPLWRSNGWRNAQGRRPANLDLFIKLDELVTAVEATGIVVGFWHVPRRYNVVADNLARQATRKGL